MYRILVADDEGICWKLSKSVISSTFGDSCITETAKTGRAVTEKAETFHPDIVFMDIHMPGINWDPGNAGNTKIQYDSTFLCSICL